MTIIKLATKEEQKSVDILDKIKSKIQILEFFEGIHKNEEQTTLVFLKTSGLNEAEAKNVLTILKDKIKEKKIQVKTEFSLHTNAENGIEKIKKVLEIPKVAIKYLGSPLYSISIEDSNYKDANRKMKDALEMLQKKAKAEACILEIKEKP